MISANCLVFPKPRLTDIKKIEKNIVYIPKDTTHKHYYQKQHIIDQLQKISNNTFSSFQTTVASLFRFNAISNIKNKKVSSLEYIPCLYFKGTYYQNKLIIYFHSNAEDLVTARNFVQKINIYTGRSVLMVEYPGYSIYQKRGKADYSDGKAQICFDLGQERQETTAENIERDATKIIQYMKQAVGYSFKDITVLGRSIGSGPAVFLASIYPIGSLILLSPFLSLCQAVRDLYGTLCSTLIKQRFNNKQRVKLIKCPTLIIHGLQDTIIPYNHSIELNKQFKTFTTLKLIQKMKHNSFNFHKQFILHVKEFLRNIQMFQQ